MPFMDVKPCPPANAVRSDCSPRKLLSNSCLVCPKDAGHCVACWGQFETKDAGHWTFSAEGAPLAMPCLSAKAVCSDSHLKLLLRGYALSSKFPLIYT